MRLVELFQSSEDQVEHEIKAACGVAREVLVHMGECVGVGFGRETGNIVFGM